MDSSTKSICKIVLKKALKRPCLWYVWEQKWACLSWLTCDQMTETNVTTRCKLGLSSYSGRFESNFSSPSPTCPEGGYSSPTCPPAPSVLKRYLIGCSEENVDADWIVAIADGSSAVATAPEKRNHTHQFSKYIFLKTDITALLNLIIPSSMTGTLTSGSELFCCLKTIF